MNVAPNSLRAANWRCDEGSAQITSDILCLFWIDLRPSIVVTAFAYSTWKPSLSSDFAKWRALEIKKKIRSLCQLRPVVIRALSTIAIRSFFGSAPLRAP